jgi:hypothetical protein
MRSSMKILNAFANISTIALLVCQGCVLTLAQENSAKILENERVVVWRIGLDTHGLSPARQLRFPAVLISLADGAVRFVGADDTSTIRPKSGREHRMRTLHIKGKLVDDQNTKVCVLYSPKDGRVVHVHGATGDST